METWNLESSGPSASTSSNYFTSILPPPPTVQNEEIRMKDTDHTGGINGVEIVQSGRDHSRYGEPLSTVSTQSRNEGIAL